MNPAIALVQAIDRAVNAGQRIPCAGCGSSELWLAEDHRERELAAEFCRSCPVLDLCFRAAEDRNERWTVMGGVNYRSPKVQRARAQRNREQRQKGTAA